jgi:hypothetical protein
MIVNIYIYNGYIMIVGDDDENDDDGGDDHDDDYCYCTTIGSWMML